MKKTLFIIAACALAAVSCQKETAVENGTSSEAFFTVTADIAQFGADTKTSIDGTATTIKPVWSANDSIKLFNTANEAFVYIVKSTDAGKASAEFEPKSTEFTGTFACAYYPADTTKYVHGTGIIAGIPSTQAYVSPAATGENTGTFANGSFPMVGTGTLDASKGNLALEFKNVFGLIQLNFTGNETIKEINLKSEKSLSGTATIATNDNRSCTITNGKKYVTLTFETPVTLDSSTPTAFYIAVPADSTVSRVYVTTSTSLQYKEKDIKASRSQIRSLNSATLTSVGFAAVTYSEASTLTPQIINGTVWAPVNCGYDATNYKYGKLYQWGRKDGQGYDGNDATYPSGNNLATGPISGIQEASAEKFYKVKTSPYNWYSGSSPAANDLWKEDGSSIYDPCPEGWRVPTMSELDKLAGGDGSGSASLGMSGLDSTNKGYWLNGTTSPSVGDGLFLPAAGFRNYYNGSASTRGGSGYYWSSSVSGDNAWLLYFADLSARMSKTLRAGGYSVRCVQE